MSSLAIVDQLYVYSEGVHWNYKLLCFSTSSNIVYLLISAYFLLNSRKPSGILEDRVNHVAKLEFYMLLICGIWMFAYPDQFCMGLRGSNESYRSMARGCGAMIIAASFQSFFVSDFIFLSDKQTFMLARLIGNMLELVVILAGTYYFKVLSSWPGLCWFASFNLAYSVFLLYGYLISSSSTSSSCAGEKEKEKSS
jgi:hypothetical protein